MKNTEIQYFHTDDVRQKKRLFSSSLEHHLENVYTEVKIYVHYCTSSEYHLFLQYYCNFMFAVCVFLNLS